MITEVVNAFIIQGTLIVIDIHRVNQDKVQVRRTVAGGPVVIEYEGANTALANQTYKAITSLYEGMVSK